MPGVGIYLYDEVEVLDFAGPFEVFSTATRIHGRAHPGSQPPFEVFTVAATPAPVRARGGLGVTPHFGFDGHPHIDVLVVPGGDHTAEMRKPEVIGWIAAQAAGAQLTAAVCTGAFLIGAAGLLAGKRAITHWEDAADLRRMLPDVRVLDGGRWVDEGAVVTSAGISAGIDMSLHLVARLAGHALAARTARQMDYAWREAD